MRLIYLLGSYIAKSLNAHVCTVYATIPAACGNKFACNPCPHVIRAYGIVTCTVNAYLYNLGSIDPLSLRLCAVCIWYGIIHGNIGSVRIPFTERKQAENEIISNIYIYQHNKEFM